MSKKHANNLTHYVYYDKKTGQLLSVGNEKDTNYDYGFKIAWEEAEPFITGKHIFRDYVVGYKKTPSGKSELAIVPVTDQGYAFKNNVFEWITPTNKPVECQVTWNKPNASWEFSIDRKLTDSYDAVLSPKLVFFVTLETDFDFLIRTIFIDLADLISTEIISVPFESAIEQKIDKISISSKLVFKSYGLKVIYE
jgi:hypothetical protein